jgi:5-methylcytosine-specific restriction endonuclease McrA
VRKYGGSCFQCGKRMKPQDLSQECTRDHVRAKSDGGRDYLHNLVLACGRCNKSKDKRDLVTYRPKKGREYLKALDEHLVRCLEQLAADDLKN